ncbi:MAG TPA: hypothetical protein VF755_18980 [Catenuloplanes sp.]
MAMTFGLATLTPGAAFATPPGGSATARAHYPPSKPDLVVKPGSVKAGKTVKATGNRYAHKEKVTVTVLFKAKGKNFYKLVKTVVVVTDKKGSFKVSVRMAKPGKVIIKGKGKTSGKSASATVNVTSKNQGGWHATPASFSVGATGGNTGLISTGDEPMGGSGVALAGLAAMAMAGSIAVTRQTVRRRRLTRVAA